MKIFSRYCFLLLALIPQRVFAATFDSIFGCPSGGCATYDDWFNAVWAWALAIAVPVSIIAIMIAGVIYSTSGGNPDRVSMAKKIIVGVLSGVGLLILSGVFRATILGV